MKSTIHSRYKTILSFLYTQLPMYQRVGKIAFKKDLNNIRAFCSELGQPHEKFPSIHIAGTNGKGSTTHIIAAILQASGLKVGCYTSPHYKDFRERIKVNGKLINKEAVVQFVETNRAIITKLRPSFFEITVAMAFDYFAAQEVDIAVIETGLGGRLDSTNIVRPLLSVITNISYDHQQFLGETLPEIAREKAGIIKLNTPVVIGEKQSEIHKIFTEVADSLNAPIVFADQCWQIGLRSIQLEHSTYTIKQIVANPLDEYKLKDAIKELIDLKVNIQGAFQQKNIVTAFQTILWLNQTGQFPIINESQIRYGLAHLKQLTYFIGRWQVLKETPLTICDSGHNIAGIQQILEQLDRLEFEQLHFVLGMVKDKDIEKVLAMLPKEARYYFVKAAIPRGLETAILEEKAKKHKLLGRSYISVKNGLKAAQRRAREQDLIFIGGSIFVVAEVL